MIMNRIKNYELRIMNNKIRIFTDLYAWQEAHKLVLMVYETTKKFPKEELFALTSQVRRAAVSVTSNIAEGFSRQSYKEKVQFYSMALGSNTEVQNQLLIAKDIKYVSTEGFKNIAEQSIEVHKLLNGLIKKSKNILNS
jgi:four helix bundle protein